MRPVVIAHIMGGLGNQMFQYAAARRLAHKRNAKLKLDLTDIDADPLGRYSLSHFRIRAEVANSTEIRELTKGRPFFLKRTLVTERGSNYDPGLKHVVPPVYLKGYWASARYFDDVSSLIRREFDIATEPSPENSVLLSEICKEENPVALHVRRPKASQSLQATQPVEYYKAAAAGLHSVAANAKFYVFSEDPEWAKDNLCLPYETVYLGNNDASANYEDLRLMRFCKHFIIANSTFSWWGAWLSERKGKVVYAPRKWFNDPSYDTRDLIPSTWIQI